MDNKSPWHIKDVHKGWYQKEDATRNLTKVGEVLLAIDAGESRNIQNKKIDSLQTRCKCHFCLFHQECLLVIGLREFFILPL